MNELCSSVVEIWSIIRIFEMCICDRLQSALVLNSSSSIPNGDEGGEKNCVTYYFALFCILHFGTPTYST